MCRTMSKRRDQRQQKLSQRRRQQTMLIGGIVLTVVVLAIAAFVLTRQPDYGTEFPDLGNQHLEAEPVDYIWNSRPPTSGPHAPGITRWGVYTEEGQATDWQVVHNLEDGGVVINYNCPQEQAGCPEMREELEAIVEEMGEEQLIVRPYSNMDHVIAVTAWTRMLTMEEVDREQIIQFIERYRGIDHHVQGIG